MVLYLELAAGHERQQQHLFYCHISTMVLADYDSLHKMPKQLTCLFTGCPRKFGILYLYKVLSQSTIAFP